jgi:hypothetical protein
MPSQVAAAVSGGAASPGEHSMERLEKLIQRCVPVPRVAETSHPDNSPRKPVYLVTYDSGNVSLEHLLLSRYPSRAQCKLLHTWIILVIVTQHLVQIGRIDGPTDYLS